MEKKLRTLVYRTGRKSKNIPCLLIGGKNLAQKYGWEVGGVVEILELPKGIFIRKIVTAAVPKMEEPFVGKESDAEREEYQH